MIQRIKWVSTVSSSLMQTITNSCRPPIDLSLDAFAPIHVALNNHTFHKQVLSFSTLFASDVMRNVKVDANRRNLSAPRFSFVSKSSLCTKEFLKSQSVGSVSESWSKATEI